jgi:T5SS/PEP-CTERM-associated repeat protein
MVASSIQFGFTMKYVTKYHILLNRLIGLFASWVLAALLVSAASAAPVLTGAGFVSGNYVYVGEFGTGTLQFNPGDTLTTTSTGSGNGYAVIGYAGPGISDPTDIGIVNINGAGASWSVQNGLFDGEYGSGTITISNGGTLTTATASGSSYQNVLGYASGSSGVMNVTGVGSTWNSGGSIFIGGNGSQSASTASGALNITQGGVVNTTVIGSYPYFQGVEVGAGVGTTATVLVDGAGSQWNLFGGGFAASEFGSAVTITVSNGGQINSPGINLGGATTGNTTMTITGADPVTGAVSTVNASITVASNLSTTTTNPAPVLNITNGGVLNSASATVGSFGSTGQGITKGIVNIDGTGSQWNITGSSLLIGSDGGVGTVTLTNGATVSDYTSTTSPATGIGDGIITLGGAPSSSNGGTPVSTATLNIGTGGVAGIVNAAGITGYAASTNPPLVSANSTIIFNHNSTGYYFTNTGTASGTGIVVSGSTKLQTVAGTTIITALDTNVGATTLNGGILSISTLGNGGVVLPTSGTTGASTVTVSNAA